MVLLINIRIHRFILEIFLKKIIRYIGSKEKLLGFLSETIFDNYKDKHISFLDGFSGTNVVSKYCQDNYQWNQYLSDISDYSEVLSSRLFISKCTPSIFSHLEKLNQLDGISGIIFNEFSIHGEPQTVSIDKFENQPIKSRLFFTKEVGQKIDAMRHYIKELYQAKEINKYDKNLLLMWVIAFADKNANTTSVYGAYLKKQDRPTIFIPNDFISTLRQEYKEKPKPPQAFLKGDIISNLDKIDHLDVAYFDPPYNTRKYESNYHILNYLSNLDFSSNMIKPESKTGLPTIQNQNLFGSKKGTRTIFKDLIEKGSQKANNIFISYSSDGEITPEEIKSICSDNNLELNVYNKSYRKFKASTIKSNTALNEIIYHIKHKDYKAK